MKSKLVHGVGINDADYITKVQENIGRFGGVQKQKVIWRCPFYARWSSMMRRCYSSSFKNLRKTYMDCEVCEDWKYFSKFKAWMETQDWEGKQLDKDILVPGNKLYSPDTCCFVTKALNLFVTEAVSNIGDYRSGVYFNKKRNKFYSQCADPFGESNPYLGSFDTEYEAHNAWLDRKLHFACRINQEIEDKRIGMALIQRYAERKAKAAQDNLAEKVSELEELQEIQELYA